MKLLQTAMLLSIIGILGISLVKTTHDLRKERGEIVWNQ